MVRIKRDRSNHITILDQELVRDSQLSWKARGIFAYLWSQSENWDFNEVEVAKHSTDGRDALRSGLKELEDAGYLDRKRERDSKGRVGSSKWVLHEKPMWKNRTQDNSMQDIGTQRSHQYKITSKEDHIKRSNSQARPDDHSQLRREIVDYLNQKLGTKYKPNASKNKTVINARLNEGYKLDDFKRVIDNKYSDWANDAKMVKYLRPETLFGSKFDGYLNEKSGRIPAKKERHYW
ncbi:conserved phage C-terminal domain-containing protein [Limosilactobacillus agrestimuris]|uniref:conserved phage C-terminal domain-containing protein n=1 Tax=Limosilactobacillus agrestimuris TaxID=2941331 RepID=UPI002041CDBD|nr:conserved phage C-terminal domain-containing protein [Limosilactobacillus agrestimuris]